MLCYADGVPKDPKPKKKTPQVLMAEYLYRYGRRDALSAAPPTGEEDEIVESRAETALRQWKASQVAREKARGKLYTPEIFDEPIFQEGKKKPQP